MSFGDWIGQSENIVFLVIGVVMLVAGFWVVTSRNLVHAVLMLVLALAGSASRLWGVPSSTAPSRVCTHSRDETGRLAQSLSGWLL